MSVIRQYSYLLGNLPSFWAILFIYRHTKIDYAKFIIKRVSGALGEHGYVMAAQPHEKSVLLTFAAITAQPAPNKSDLAY